MDILFDKDCKPLLLEINGNPSLNILLPEPQKLLDETIFISKVDLHIKRKAVEGAIELALMPINKQQMVKCHSYYESLDLENTIKSQDMTLFRDLIDIFKKLQGSRFQTNITKS